MLYCPKCRVYVRGERKTCPLCQSPLTGTAENPAFPKLHQRSISRFSTWKLALFVTIVFEVVMGSIWFMTHSAWPLWAMLFGIIALGDILVVLYYHNSLIKRITLQMYMAMAILLVIDQRTGWHGWSLEWVIPFMFILLIPLTIIIERASHLTLEDYVIYLFLDVLFSLAQLPFILNHANRHPLSAVISIAFMIVFAAFILIFHGREFKNAGGKYFNL